MIAPILTEGIGSFGSIETIVLDGLNPAGTPTPPYSGTGFFALTGVGD